MSSPRIGKASGERRCGSAASLIRPCGALPWDSLNRRCPGGTLVQTGEYFLWKLCAKNRPQFCCLTFAGHAPRRGTSRVAENAEKESPGLPEGLLRNIVSRGLGTGPSRLGRRPLLDPPHPHP